MLRVQIHTREIPGVFKKFSEVVGEGAWLKRESRIKSEIRGHGFLKDYLIEENQIALSLSRYSYLFHHYNGIPARDIENRQLYPAIKFAAQVLSMLEISTPAQQKQFIRRIHGAINNPDDMRALQLELAVATHFVRKGYKIAWPEMEGFGRYDLLVEDVGGTDLEVECKSVSANKGRKIHRRYALIFYHLIHQKIKLFVNNLRTGLLVVLSLPDRLPTHEKEKKEIVSRIVKQLHIGSSADYGDGVSIRISEFDPREIDALEGNTLTPETRKIVDRLTSTRNREVMAIRVSLGAFIIVLTSKRDDDVLNSIYKTLKTASESQLSKNNPGLLVVGLNSIDAGTLVDIASQDFDSSSKPTELRLNVSKFLSSQVRNHVVGVGFMSNENLKPVGRGNIESAGKVYFFPKEDSVFWNEAHCNLFV